MLFERKKYATIGTIQRKKEMTDMARLGIIGTGNMGEAILRGALKGRAIQAHQVAIYDVNINKAETLSKELGVAACSSVDELASNCAIILLAVKPNIVAGLLDQNRAQFCDKAVFSIVAGWSGACLRDNLPKDARILRVMPNTPAMVGEGMIVFEKGDSLRTDEKEFATALFSTLGRVESVGAELMDAVTGLSGSGPAYVYLFIEALSDAGVQQGLPRAIAYELAAQTVLGSAKMVQETGSHPGELKDRVCSPGGTTIDAVATLEKRGFRGAVIDAVAVCANKSKEMSNHI